MKPKYKLLLVDLFIISIFTIIMYYLAGTFDGIILGIFVSLAIDATYIIDEMHTIYTVMILDSVIISSTTLLIYLLTESILGGLGMGIACACSVDIVYIIADILHR